MKSVDPERIIASVPQNSTAAKVLSKGVHFTPNMTIETTYVHSDMPPALAEVTPMTANSSTYRELAGKTFGRWRVIGLSAEQNYKKKARWVVRCACGRYENRKAPSIRLAASTGDCCAECKYLQRIKNTYRKLGGKPVESFGKSPAQYTHAAPQAHESDVPGPAEPLAEGSALAAGPEGGDKAGTFTEVGRDLAELIEATQSGTIQPAPFTQDLLQSKAARAIRDLPEPEDEMPDMPEFLRRVPA